MIKKLVWLHFVAALLLAGCSKPESTIGVDNLPDSDFFILSTDTFGIDLVTVRDDSLVGGNQNTALFGKIFHPHIGEASARFTSQLRLSSPNQNFGTGAVADSIKLRLRHVDNSHGMFTDHRIEVRQLVDSLSYESTYYTSFEPEAVHGSLVAPNHPFVSIKALASTDSEDEDAFLEITLDSTLGQTLIELDSTVYSSNESWLEYFPGIIVSSSSGMGAAGFDISSKTSVMRLYYHNESDTTYYDFELAELSRRVNLFSNDYVSTLDNLNMVDPDSAYVSGDEQVYIMGGGGLNLRLSIPSLEAINDSLGPDRSIQKASLILAEDESKYDIRYSAPDYLIAGVKVDDGYIELRAGEFNDSEKEYRIDLTVEIQRMINHYSGMGSTGIFSPDKELPPLYITASNRNENLKGVVLKGTSFSNNPARLVVTYSH